MAKNNELEQRRAEALARHKAATRKVGRLRRNGVDVSGTRLDVRRDPAKIAKYNTRQLDAYINQLNSFVDRKTQYVPDTFGRPMRKAVMDEYKSTERKINKIVNDAYDRIKNINLPGQNRTIDDRMEAITPRHKHAGNAANAPYRPIVRQSKNFLSEKKLKQMIAKNKKKLQTDFLARDLKTDLRVIKEMSDTLKRPDIYRRVKALSPDQFNILFNFWGFIDKISLPYEVAKEDSKSGKSKEWFQPHLDRNLKEADRLIGYAEKIQLGR